MPFRKSIRSFKKKWRGRIKTPKPITQPSLRFCLVCIKNRNFEYDPATKHSRCEACREMKSGKPRGLNKSEDNKKEELD